MAKIEDGLYNYIAAKPKLFRGVAVVFIVVLLGSILKYYADVFSDQNVSYYLFSTIVQGFLALVGFLGAVALFKLQNIENDANNTANFIRPTLVGSYGEVAANGYSSIEMMNATERIVQGRKETAVGDPVQIAYTRLKNLFDEKSKTRRAMVDFSLWSFVNVLLALMGIPVSKLFVFYSLFLPLALYSIVNISLSIGSLFAAFIMVRGILGYSFTMRIGTGRFHAK